MNSVTHKILNAALSADSTIAADQRIAALALLNGKTPQKELLPLVLTQKQAAKLLGVSRFTIRRMTAEGELHPVKVHESFRYRRAEIEEIAAGISVNA